MNDFRTRSLLVALGVFTLQLLSTQSASAAISNGMAAMDVIGQYDANVASTLVPIYTKAGANNSPNRQGFNTAMQATLDTVGHRLFVTEFTGNRVLVFALTSDNLQVNKIPVNVLGQADFNISTLATTQSGMRNPYGTAYDSGSQRLFVADYSNRRVLVYDLSGGISNGMNARYVLGQADFTSNASAVTQTGMINPVAAVYDAATSRLYVSDQGQRVLVYSLAAGISNGMNASYVLGQADFTSNAIATTQAGMNGPEGLAFDSGLQRLFVTNYLASRVLVYDAATTTTGMNASYVLGQANFTSAAVATTQTGMNAPNNASYDTATSRLFVSDYSNNRILVYSLAAGISNGMNASYVLGQANFTSATAAITQSGMRSARGSAYDPATGRLFMADYVSNRVTVYDAATTTNGQNAIDVIGQYDANSIDPFSTTVIYTKGAASNVANRLGLNLLNTGSPTIDSVHHRLFLPEQSNNRVLVFNLNSDNTLVDKVPDFVIGQPDFNSNTGATTQAAMNFPRHTLYEPVSQRLFVGETGSNRVSVYDLSGGISNGMNAAYVLGQANFTSGGSATTQVGMNAPRGIAYDSARQLLYVSAFGNGRVTVYSLAAGISNGMNAAYVLGQTDFTTGTANSTQIGLNVPGGLAFDAANGRLFVAQTSGNRVSVFDLSATTTTGMNAAYVLGQANFTANTPAATQSGMASAGSVSYDSLNQRLFVGELGTGNNRVSVYDLSGGISNGMNAANVIGQPNFTSSAATTTQTGISGPAGMLFDSTSQRLWVLESGNNRATIFDVTPASGGGAHCPAYKLSLSRPLGGESWKAGNTENILWTLDGCQTTHLTISLSTDGGLTYATLSDTANFSSGFYAWHVPDLTTSSAKIKLQAFGPGSTVLATAVSGAFTLTGSGTNSPMNPPTPPTDSSTSTPETSPTPPPAPGTGCTQDSLIKASTPAVYWCGFDSMRHPFPNEAVYYSWYKDFKAVITISDSQLASIPLGSTVLFHPGILLKLQTDPKVYVVADKTGLLNPIPDEATAKRLYGPKWNTLIKDLDEALFTGYTVGEALK